MKVEFWKNRTELIIFSILLVLSFILILIGTMSFATLFPFFICGSLLGISCIITLFFYKAPLTKIFLSNDGIECKWFKHKITLISWEEIFEVKENQRSFALSYLRLIAKNKQIDIDLTKKIYKTIIILCPYEHIKTEINIIPYFKYLHE